MAASFDADAANAAAAAASSEAGPVAPPPPPSPPPPLPPIPPPIPAPVSCVNPSEGGAYLPPGATSPLLSVRGVAAYEGPADVSLAAS